MGEQQGPRLVHTLEVREGIYVEAYLLHNVLDGTGIALLPFGVDKRGKRVPTMVTVQELQKALFQARAALAVEEGR